LPPYARQFSMIFTAHLAINLVRQVDKNTNACIESKQTFNSKRVHI